MRQVTRVPGGGGGGRHAVHTVGHRIDVTGFYPESVTTLAAVPKAIWPLALGHLATEFGSPGGLQWVKYYHPQPAGEGGVQNFKNQMLKLTSCQVYKVKTQLDVTKEILRKWPARESMVRGIEVHRFVALCNLFKTVTKFDHTG